MKKSTHAAFLNFSIASMLLVLIANCTKVSAQAVAPFVCNGNYYVTYGNGTDPASSTSIDKVTYNGTAVTATFQGTTNNIGFNGADINPIDGLMYGIQYSNSSVVTLLKIDTNANVTVVGTLPTSVNGSQSVYSGCFDANGDFYIGNLPVAGIASNIYKVNTANANATLVGSTGVLPDDPNGQLFFVDISIDPTTGIMYGASNYCCNETGPSSKALFTIDKTTGTATEIGQFTTATGFQTSGYGLFFTSTGDLFLYGTDANFYIVNKTTAQITLLGSGSTYSFADGCSCSFRIDHTLAASAPVICLPDTNSTTAFSFTETFMNNRGSLVTGAGYHLDLDKRFQFTQTPADIKNILLSLGIATNATTVSITGINGGTNNSIDISPINIPFTGPGTKTSFVLNTLFTNSPGLPTIMVASDIYNLPAIIGGQVSSDNPVTLTPGDSTKITLCSGGVLPVTFIALNAVTDAAGNILVQWQTADELNVHDYEVERSTDGTNFTTLGTIAADNAGKYSYTDNAAPLSDKLFYRIKATDVSGGIDVTPIVTVSRSQSQSTINITPNPFKDNVQLQVSSSKEQLAVVRIFGQDGKLYQNYQFKIPQGTSITSLGSAASLPSGVYAVFVDLTGTGQVFTKKIVKE
jgi:hypothetical protein